MKAKHTTGPWVIDWNVSRLDIFGADETTLVASLRRSTLSQAIDEAARSNARLIAAAPDMRETILALCDALDELRVDNERLRTALTKINVGDGWAAQIARAALAQKEGK